MIDILQSAVSFVVAIGILVTVHEFGHFWVARKLGVKVLRFSVGFGKPLFKKTGKDGVEYVVAAIPLGGYVRMLGESDDEVTEANRHQAFNHKPLSVKAAIVIAGPMLNFIFAILAYWLMYTVGIPGQVAMLGEIEPNSIAAHADMKPDEQIVQISEQKTATWSAVNAALLDVVIDSDEFTIHTVTEYGSQRRYTLPVEDRANLLDDKGVVRNLGLNRWRPPVWIGKVVAGGAADKAGFQKGDLVLSADDQSISNWRQWVEYISQRPGQDIKVTVRRSGGETSVTVRPEPVDYEGKTIGRIGVHGHIPDEVRERHLAVEQYGLIEGGFQSISKTWDLSILMLKMLGKMVVGEASHKNISGGITIAQYAGITAELGWLEFVRFLALISISLGVLNLLPIPMLDGGHLLYYVIESVHGRPLSEQAMAMGQQIGISFLFLLMLLAFYNDFNRLFG